MTTTIYIFVLNIIFYFHESDPLGYFIINPLCIGYERPLDLWSLVLFKKGGRGPDPKIHLGSTPGDIIETKYITCLVTIYV